MRAVVLAGGEGKRVTPLGRRRPKPLYEVMGRPLIGYVLDALSGTGIDEAVVVTGTGRGEAIRAALGDEAAGMRLHYAVQTTPRGQADALQAARAVVGEVPVLVVNANDVYDPALLPALVERAADDRLDVALVGRAVETPEKFGVLDLDDRDRLRGVVEKPSRAAAPSRMAVVGVYRFSARIWGALDATPAGQADDQLERAYSALITDGRAGWLRYDGPFASFKYPWDLLTISDLLLERRVTRRISDDADISPHAVLSGDVVAAPGVRVFEGAVVRGPAYLGDGAIVGNGALLRGGVSLGRRCVVGYGSEVSHSVLGDDTWLHMNFVGDSVLAGNCSLGAGTITANLRFDEAPVEVRVGRAADAPRRSTGEAHFGVIMAEDCRTGCNAVLSPGARIGPGSIVGPGVVLRDDLPPGKIALLEKDSYRVRDNRLDVAALSRGERLASLPGGDEG